MKLSRIKELECSQAKLTDEEIAEGWHYCLECDGMLCHPDMKEAEVCGCEVIDYLPLVVEYNK